MARYARLEVTLIIVIGGAITAAAGYTLHLWAVAPALLSLALLSFYRDPPRRIPPGGNILVSPADGKVTEVSRVVERAGEAAQLHIGIFLSVANVHINRSPCAGRVTDVKYTPGKFLNALKQESARVNENNVVTIEPRAPIAGPIRVRQIAGALARRIVCTARPGDDLTAGERFGMIKLGSRTELDAPDDARWEVLVRVGDRVKAGSTVLARLRTDDGD